MAKTAPNQTLAAPSNKDPRSIPSKTLQAQMARTASPTRMCDGQGGHTSSFLTLQQLLLSAALQHCNMRARCAACKLAPPPAAVAAVAAAAAAGETCCFRSWCCGRQQGTWALCSPPECCHCRNRQCHSSTASESKHARTAPPTLGFRTSTPAPLPSNPCRTQPPSHSLHSPRPPPIPPPNHPQGPRSCGPCPQ